MFYLAVSIIHGIVIIFFFIVTASVVRHNVPQTRCIDDPDRGHHHHIVEVGDLREVDEQQQRYDDVGDDKQGVFSVFEHGGSPGVVSKSARERGVCGDEGQLAV